MGSFRELGYLGYQSGVLIDDFRCGGALNTAEYWVAEFHPHS